MVYKRTSLTVAALTSTLLLISPVYADVTVVADEFAQRSTSVDANITIETTGSITTNGTSAVNIDSASTLTINPNNVSGGQPGIVMINNAVAADGAVNVSTDGGQIKIGSGSGITADDGNGVYINASGVNINNSGSITGATTDGKALDGIHFANGKTTPTIVNQASGVISGDRAGIYFDATTGISLTNASGNTISSTATAAANSYGIYFNNNSAGILTNTGTISSATGSASSAAIYANNGGSTLTITNNSGGALTSAAGRGIHFDAATTNINLTFTNAGTVTAATDGIRLDGDGTIAITNDTGGVITAGSSGIVINDNITGTLTNNGTMTSKGDGIQLGQAANAITVVNAGSITNTNNAASGAIRVTATGGQGSITNSGTLAATGTSANAFLFQGAFTGDVTNSGSASTDQHVTLNIGGAITGDVVNSGTLSLTTDVAQSVVKIDSLLTGSFTNSGTISSASTTTAAVDINANITGGFINSGNITVAGATAIDFSGVGAAFTLTQNGGTIGGAIEGGNAFADTININGGTISGNINLGPGANTINISGGSVTGNIVGNGNNDTLNILNDFTSTGQINGLKIITVQNAGTEFIATGPINNIVAGGTLTIDAGATLLTNSTITEAGALGTLKNQGIFGVGDGGTATFGASNFVNDGLIAIGNGGAQLTALSLTQTAPGNATYAFEVTDTTDFGTIVTNSAATNVTNDSFVVVLNGQGFIQSGDQFKVFDNQANAIVGANTITVSTDILTSGIETLGRPSLSLSFFNVGNANNITLQAVRNSFQGLTLSDNATAVATALDALVNDPNINPDLQAFIAQVDVQPSAAEITAVLETLAPMADNGLMTASFDMHNRAVNTVVGRLNNARSFYDFWKGLSSGDEPYYGIGVWGQVFASRLSQQELAGVQGYKSFISGATFGVDKWLDHQWMLGGALTYSTGDIESRMNTINKTDVTAMQLTAYSTYDSLDAWYLDVIASIGLNHYESTRQIQAGTFQRTAMGDFKAWQYSIQGQSGYNFSYGKYRITPLLGLRYGSLDMDPYTESGAGGVGLTVVPKNVSELVTSFGVRFASVFDSAGVTYMPETRIMAHYDFLRELQASTNNFIGNGNVYFDTHGPKPDPLTYNIGVALTALSGTHMSFIMNYDFTWKDQFVGHSAFIKMKYEW